MITATGAYTEMTRFPTPVYTLPQVKAGTKVRTLSQFSEPGVIMRPRKVNLPFPGPDWYVVKFDAGGALCIQRRGFAIANDA
jgi:hypothetical protein